MKIKKESLIYDISALAYTIADNHDDSDASLHRLRDICEDGNIDRVSRILGLAYANLLNVLLPVISPPSADISRDFSASPHDYEFIFRDDESVNYSLTKERQLKIKESSREYMVCMVLADRLDITLPPAADVWRFKAETAFNSLKEIVMEIVSHTTATGGFTRRLSPF